MEKLNQSEDNSRHMQGEDSPSTQQTTKVDGTLQKYMHATSLKQPVWYRNYFQGFWLVASFEPTAMSSLTMWIRHLFDQIVEKLGPICCCFMMTTTNYMLDLFDIKIYDE